MARYAVIESGRVLTVAEADAEFAAAQGWVEAGDTVSPGMAYGNGQFAPYRGTVAERKARLREQIEARRDQCFQAGFTVPSGPLAGKVLQTRGIEDRTNWLTSQAAYGAAISQGAGNVTDASFRTADNETVVLTYSEGFAALMMMAAWGKAVMGNSWALKDAVNAASTHAALDAIDVEVGWP